MALEQKLKMERKNMFDGQKLQKKKSFMLKKDLGSTSQTNEKVRSCAARQSQLAPKKQNPYLLLTSQNLSNQLIFLVLGLLYF